MKRARGVIPDVLLFVGVVCALGGAYLFDWRAAVFAAGVGLIALAVWMGG